MLDLCRVGHGCPDILVGLRGRNWLIEIKAGSNDLTPDQRTFFAKWRGQRAVVRSVGEALRVVTSGL